MDVKTTRKHKCEICAQVFQSVSELEKHKPKHLLNLNLTPTSAGILETPSPMKELRGKVLETPVISAFSPQVQAEIPQTCGLSGINLTALAATDSEPQANMGSSNPFEASFKSFNAKKVQLTSNPSSSSAWIESVPTPDIINAKISTPQIREALSNVKDSSPLDLSPAKIPRLSEPSASAPTKHSGLQLLANTVLSAPQSQIQKSDDVIDNKKKHNESPPAIGAAAAANMISVNTNDVLQQQLLRVQQMANQAQQSYLISLPGNKNLLVQPQVPQQQPSEQQLQQAAHIPLQPKQEVKQAAICNRDSIYDLHPSESINSGGVDGGAGGVVGNYGVVAGSGACGGKKAEVIETLRKKVMGNLPADELDRVRQSAAAGSSSSTKRPAESTTSSGDERRKLLLERNRAAAARCREKRKKHIEELEERNAQLEQEKEQLAKELGQMRAEMKKLQRFFNAHQTCADSDHNHLAACGSRKPAESSQSIASSSHSPEVSSPPFLQSAITCTSSVECPSE